MSSDFLVNFGIGGNYRKWSGPGWSQDSDRDDFTWMLGHSASLQFAFAPPASDLTLTLRVMPVKGSTVEQSLFLYLNGRFVGFLTGSAVSDFSFPIPSGFFSSQAEKLNTLTFVAPNAIVPAKVGKSADQRCLSFGFLHLAIHE